MKHKDSSTSAEAGGSSSGGGGYSKPIKEGLVSQIASKFQQTNNKDIPTTNPVIVRKKSDSILAYKASSSSDVLPVKKTSLVSRTESHQTRFNNARAMFEKMGSTDDLDSISSGGQNRYILTTWDLFQWPWIFLFSFNSTYHAKVLIRPSAAPDFETFFW